MKFDKEIFVEEAHPWRWPNFKPEELISKGNRLLLVNEQSLDALQKLRNLIGVPLIINSAYRDPAYNKKVGGAPRSQHLLGRAYDIHLPDESLRAKIHKLGKEAGFTGFGDYNTFIHVDTGPIRYWDFRS